MIPLLLAILGRAGLELNRAWGTWWARWRLGVRSITPGRGFRVCGSLDISIHRTARVSIGSDCDIISYFGANPTGGWRRTQIWVGPGAHLIIGNRVGLSHCSIICMKAITLEDDVLIGGGATLNDCDWHSLDPVLRRHSPDPDVRSAPIVVKRGAFVGASAMVLKGATIGAGSIVGAGAVAAGSIPDGQIWAGNPARFIRELPASGFRPNDGVCMRHADTNSLMDGM